VIFTNTHIQQMMKRNIEPVILDNLAASKDDIPCSAPDVVLDIHLPSRFGKPEVESPIICSLCQKKGHNKRTCLRRKSLAPISPSNNENQPMQSTLDLIQWTLQLGLFLPA
jgi:hypothetical protein